MTMARIQSRHRDSLCTVCLRLTCSRLMPLSVAELLAPPHTTERSITKGFGHFEALFLAQHLPFVNELAA